MKEHRDKGLCYNYDEKYDSDHQCTIKKFYLLNADDIDDSIDEEEEVTMEEVAKEVTFIMKFMIICKIGYQNEIQSC